MNPMDVKEYPWRVKKLAEKLKGMNGDPLTAQESRDLIKLVSETQLDLWDLVIEFTTELEQKIKWFEKCVAGIQKVAIGLLITVTGGVLLWLLTKVLPEIIAHIEAAQSVVQ